MSADDLVPRDDEADDDSLRPLRSVWLSMRDEDPPDGGMAALLAAARRQADVMRPQPTWWARAFAAMRRPPVLAFAGIAVLVSGALVLGGRRAELTAPTRPTAEPPLHEPAAPPAADPAPAAEAKPAAPAIAAPVAPSQLPPAPPKAAPRRRATTPAPPPALETPLGGAEQTGDAAAATATATAVPAAPEPGVPASTLAKAAARAAARGDCAATRTETSKLGTVDRAARDALVARNAAVARCVR